MRPETKKMRRFEDSTAWQAAADLAVQIFEFTQSQAFLGKGSLRNQLERATLSISNNIAEGFERGTTNELLQFLYIAKGSAGEVRSMLRVLMRMRDFQGLKSQVSSLTEVVEGISKQLYAWCQGVQNSKLKGQKFLNDESRAEYAVAEETARRDHEKREFLRELQLEHEERLQVLSRPHVET